MSATDYKSNLDKDLFWTECDDVEDETFLRHSSAGSSGYMLNNSSNKPMSLEERRQQLIERRKEIQEKSVLSTERSLSYLRTSEEVGIAAAEELLRQREQLERTERSLDNINTTLRFSQKRIQGIKSVFGGLKNFFRSGVTIPEGGTTSRVSDDLQRSQLHDALNDLTSVPKSDSDDHPALRLKNHSQFSSDVEESAFSDHQKRIDKNLDEMLGSISKLKGLAHGLGEEIECHNDILEKVITKTEKADDSLKMQTKSINRLLR